MHLTSEFKIHLEYIPIFKIEYPQFLFDTELELYLYNYREISLEYRVLRTIGQMYSKYDERRTGALASIGSE